MQKYKILDTDSMDWWLICLFITFFDDFFILEYAHPP